MPLLKGLREMNIKICKAKISDLKTVTELCMILYEAKDYNYLENENKRLLQNKNQAIFLAFDDEKAVAFAHCSLRFDYVESTNSSPAGYLEGIYVEPKYRNQGLAKKLVTELIGARHELMNLYNIEYK